MARWRGDAGEASVCPPEGCFTLLIRLLQLCGFCRPQRCAFGSATHALSFHWLHVPREPNPKGDWHVSLSRPSCVESVCHPISEFSLLPGILDPSRETPTCQIQRTRLRHSSWQGAAQNAEALRDMHSCQRSYPIPVFFSPTSWWMTLLANGFIHACRDSRDRRKARVSCILCQLNQAGTLSWTSLLSHQTLGTTLTLGSHCATAHML